MSVKDLALHVIEVFADSGSSSQVIDQRYFDDQDVEVSDGLLSKLGESCDQLLSDGQWSIELSKRTDTEFVLSRV